MKQNQKAGLVSQKYFTLQHNFPFIQMCSHVEAHLDVGGANVSVPAMVGSTEQAASFSRG